VCFIVLSRTLLAGENINIGGFALKILKKLKRLYQLPKDLWVLAGKLCLKQLSL
jgi:hypothetical protein